MKKLFVLCLSMTLAGAAFSQSDMHSDKMESGKMKDCIMMKDGKMMVMKGGMSSMLMHDTTVSKGTMVMKDGMVKMTDGSTHMMKDGECIMNGKVKMMKMDKMDKKMSN